MYAKTQDECFWMCFNMPKCLAFRWSWRDANVCHLKFDLSKPVDCDFYHSCAVVTSYRTELTVYNHQFNTKYCYQVLVQSALGFNGEFSEKICFYCNASFFFLWKYYLFELLAFLFKFFSKLTLL